MRPGSSSRWAALGLAVAASAWLGGCATWNPAGLTALRASAGAAAASGPVLLPTPFVAPEAGRGNTHCGPAALAMALANLGRAVPVEQLAREVHLPARAGSLQAELVAGARRHGVLATRIDPSLQGLVRELAAGRPVVVLQNLGLALAPRWHYAVVVGYDLATQTMVLHSGDTPELRMSLRTFGHTWARSGHWGLVVHEPGTWPETVDEARAVESAVGFERASAATLAATVYASGHQRWPDNLAFMAGLGNTAHAQGMLATAAHWYRRAALQHDSASAWLNLAITLRSLGRPVEAAEAALAAGRSESGRLKPQADAVLAAVNR